MCVYRYDTCERGSMSTHMLSIEEVISEGITLTTTVGIDIYCPYLFNGNSHILDRTICAQLQSHTNYAG